MMERQKNNSNALAYLIKLKYEGKSDVELPSDEELKELKVIQDGVDQLFDLNVPEFSITSQNLEVWRKYNNLARKNKWI